MGFLHRLLKIGQANAKRVLENLEKPEQLLDQAILDQERALVEAKKGVQEAIAIERRMKGELDEEIANQKLWESHSITALKEGDEARATQAVIRSDTHERKALLLQPQWETRCKEIDRLKAGILQSEEELAELRNGKAEIDKQNTITNAKNLVYNIKNRSIKNTPEDLMDRVTTTALRSSDKADALLEMSQTTPVTPHENEFSRMEKEASDASIQAKLAALKVKINS